MSTSPSEPKVYDILSSSDELHRRSRLKAALEAGADPNLPDRRGYVPLSCRSVYADPVVFDLLLRAGADPNAQSYEDYVLPEAVAQFAALRNRQQIADLQQHIRRLLWSGADPNRSMHGVESTALWRAIHRGWIDVVADLLEAGADLDQINAQGTDALEWALLCERPKLAVAVAGPQAEVLINARIPDKAVARTQSQIAERIRAKDHVLSLELPGVRYEFPVSMEYFWSAGQFVLGVVDTYVRPVSTEYEPLGYQPSALFASIEARLQLDLDVHRPRRRSWGRLLTKLQPRNANHCLANRYPESTSA